MTVEERLRAGTIRILAVGFAAAILIFLIAQEPGGNPLGYDPLATKKYVHDLQVYGGTANVLAAQFTDWFVSLWQGKQLALTVAVLTVITVFVFRFFAVLPPADDDDGDKAGDAVKRLAGPNVARFERKQNRK
jgi:hypothetical protein